MDRLQIFELMSAEHIEDQVCRIVAELFNQPAERIAPESSPHSIEGWDSLGHLNLALALEQEFGVTFAPEQIDEMTDVRKIVDIVARMDHQGSQR